MNNSAAKNISIFFLDIVTKDLASKSSITKSKWREYQKSPSPHHAFPVIPKDQTQKTKAFQRFIQVM
jgi:hypothetical protein